LAGSGGKPWKKGASKLENDACEMFDHWIETRCHQMAWRHEINAISYGNWHPIIGPGTINVVCGHSCMLQKNGCSMYEWDTGVLLADTVIR
jgi:hypothetical protein